MVDARPQPVHLIAEVGSVHDGSLGNAMKLIEAAAEAGAGAVKFQTHLPEAESLPGAPSPAFFSAEDRMDYFRRTGFSAGQWAELKAHADDHKITFLSSAFSIEAVSLLEELGVEAHKVPSGEVTNHPLLEVLAATGKPVYLSSGMSTWRELDAAVAVLEAGGPLTVMHCASVYPCPPERVGLNNLALMRERYGSAVGYSDHTLGIAAPVAAVALGATVVEKHFSFSRRMYGSDAAHSMEPGEFQTLAETLAQVSAMLAHPTDKDDVDDVRDMKRVFEKSVVTARAVPAGTELHQEDLAFKKPGDGISAADSHSVIGRVTTHDLPVDHQLALADLR